MQKADSTVHPAKLQHVLILFIVLFFAACSTAYHHNYTDISSSSMRYRLQATPVGRECGDGLEYKNLSTNAVPVPVQKNIDHLISEEDTDNDNKITIKDSPVPKSGRGDERFLLIALDGKRYEVRGTYYLSNLLQELKLAEESGKSVASIHPQRIFESPVRRISGSIREIYWDTLTRSIDADNLDRILKDKKVAAGGYLYMYVPYADDSAYEYFMQASQQHPELNIRIKRLPAEITPQYVRSIEQEHGLLTLALERTPGGDYVGVPFVVPGGRFNEMYGWDSYFEALGLLVDGRVDLAKAMVDNLVYQIGHYGKILNANRTYYLTRSQPPFLTSMALAVYENLPKDESSKAWIKRVCMAAINEYRDVWMNTEHLTEVGLSRYYGTGLGPPPEVEDGHFRALYSSFARKLNTSSAELEQRYREGIIKIPELDAYFVHDRCIRESGHDTTYRWKDSRCADFVTVDLNSLLYKMEIDIALVIEREFGGTLINDNGIEETSGQWYELARKRKALIKKYLWDEQSGMFYDYDVVKKRRYEYDSATALYPLWACHKEDPRTWLLMRQEAERLVSSALSRLEMPGGVAASSEHSRGPISKLRPARQWDYPNGWAPHQMVIWDGLHNYGFHEIEQRLIYRWLYTITRNAVDHNGTVPEKFDVVGRSHDVFAEYGNVGTKFSYITKEGFGWMNASYQVGLKRLSKDLHPSLDRLVPPEWLFFTSAVD